MVKKLPANARNIRDACLISGVRRSPRGGHGNPLQYSCLKNPKDRGVWWAPGVARSGTRVKQLSTHAYKISRIVKFLESESALVDFRGQKWGMGMGI